MRLALLALLGLAACSTASDTATVPDVALPAMPMDLMKEATQTLSSDAFEGRAPGTPGEEKTLAYLVDQFQKAGLQPGNNGSWFQDVPLVAITAQNVSPLTFTGGSQPISLKYGPEMVVGTYRVTPKISVKDSPVVFVGYGINAPEKGWNDYAGVDVKGKTVVILVNDPDWETAGLQGEFNGQAMTYYGRWTYKFEEASRRGAIGALIVHDTDGVGYGWNVIKSPGGENYGLVKPPEQVTSLALQGWISGETATSLFANAGQDLAKLRTAARRKDFKPVDLGTAFNAALPVTQEVVQSQNVLARISGAKRPDEVVMYGAHWDAYGEGAPDEKGRIYRAGANDDALGVAGLFEIARLFKAAPAPDRTIAFAFWTAEERGLLGSEAYAQDPVFPAEKTVANFGLDILQTAGRAKDVVLVGKGQGSLEDDLARVAKAQGRTVSVESLPERGLFYRADHFSLAKRGVPVLLMMGIAGASDLVEGGKKAGQAWVDAYTGKCYHQACDAWDESWNLDGAVQDIDLFYQLGDELARSARWPEWKAGSEFKAIRDASAAARK